MLADYYPYACSPRYLFLELLYTYSLSHLLLLPGDSCPAFGSSSPSISTLLHYLFPQLATYSDSAGTTLCRRLSLDGAHGHCHREAYFDVLSHAAHALHPRCVVRSTVRQDEKKLADADRRRASRFGRFIISAFFYLALPFSLFLFPSRVLKPSVLASPGGNGGGFLTLRRTDDRISYLGDHHPPLLEHVQDVTGAVLNGFAARARTRQSCKGAYGYNYIVEAKKILTICYRRSARAS